MLYIKITFPFDRKDEYVIESNVKPQFIEEMLCEFLSDQVGSGAKKQPIIERGVYTLTIFIDIANDRFSIKHDAGCPCFALGVVANVLAREGQKVVV